MCYAWRRKTKWPSHCRSLVSSSYRNFSHIEALTHPNYFFIVLPSIFTALNWLIIDEISGEMSTYVIVEALMVLFLVWGVVSVALLVLILRQLVTIVILILTHSRYSFTLLSWLTRWWMDWRWFRWTLYNNSVLKLKFCEWWPAMQLIRPERSCLPSKKMLPDVLLLFYCNVLENCCLRLVNKNRDGQYRWCHSWLLPKLWHNSAPAEVFGRCHLLLVLKRIRCDR